MPRGGRRWFRPTRGVSCCSDSGAAAFFDNEQASAAESRHGIWLEIQSGILPDIGLRRLSIRRGSWPSAVSSGMNMKPG